MELQTTIRKQLREINMLVKTFGNEVKRLDANEYEIGVQSCSGEVILINAIAVPTTCDKIEGQVVKKRLRSALSPKTCA